MNHYGQFKINKTILIPVSDASKWKTGLKLNTYQKTVVLFFKGPKITDLPYFFLLPIPCGGP